MESLDGCVIGFNSPKSFVFASGKVLVPAANAVVASIDGESSLWQPLDGNYAIDKICVNPQQTVLCLSERRLSVAIHVFGTSDLRKLGKVPEIASVGIEDMCFGPTGSTLFVLCTIPSFTVKVLHSQQPGKFALSSTVDLSGSNFFAVIGAEFAQKTDDLLVISHSGVLGYRCGSNKKYEECMGVSMQDNNLSCGAAVSGGVIYGTTKGEVHKYMIESRVAEIIPFEVNEGGITSIDVMGDSCLIGTVQGSVYELNCSTNEVVMLCRLKTPAARIVSNREHQLVFVGTDQGLFQLDRGSNNEVVPVKQRFPEVVKCFPVDEATMVVVCIDGSFAVLSLDGVYMWMTNVSTTILDACRTSTGKFLTIGDDESIRGFSSTKGEQLWCKAMPDFKPLRCESNQEGRCVVCSATGIYFLVCEGENCTSWGFIQSHEAPLAVVRWVDSLNSFLVACTNGEVHHIRFPSSCSSEDQEHIAESLLEFTWRLDYPVFELFPCFVEDNIINILVHSADKETKLYVLEKRANEREVTKVLRPHFLMRDHESGGSCLLRFDDATALSAGKDGRVVLREIKHYQAKLSPIPPSKEKRKTLFDETVRHFSKHGILTAALLGSTVACGGKDSVMRLIPVDERDFGRWQEPLWIVQSIGGQLAESGGDDIDMERFLAIKRELHDRIGYLRQDWSEVIAQQDIEVPIESLLLPDRKTEFLDSCSNAIYEMRQFEHYNALKHEYTQDCIKSKCCDSMDVIRSKVIGVKEKKIEVHNFHILKSGRAKDPLARKAQFLRRLQKKVSAGHYFKDLRDQPNAKTICGSEEYENDSISDLLYSPFDVYTHARSVLQSVLLKAFILLLKDNFNSKFCSLREKKRRTVTLIEERTTRCIQIIKQLGEAPGGLFAVAFDREEDPQSLFMVYDDELDEDIRALVVKDQGIKIYSPSNEAALKLWMDGLEKDVELLQVNMPPPEFADETRESFVSPEDRTEEQAKIMEDYEKLLAEETERVNIKRESLRNEFIKLQKENGSAAEQIDNELRSLRELRILTAERIDEVELQLVKLLEHLTTTSETFGKYTELNRQKSALERELQYATTLFETKRAAAEGILFELHSLEQSIESFTETIRDEYPFTDLSVGDKLFRRMGRWKKKFDEGKASVPDSNKVPDDIPEELWAAFCDHCEDLMEQRGQADALEERFQAQSKEFKAIEGECNGIRKRIVNTDEKKANLKADFAKNLLNTQTLYRLFQGQVQDERTSVSSDFASSCLRWAGDVHQYNQLILESDKDSHKFLEKIMQRLKNMKFFEWETERLRYCVGTLEMQLRQLHTLRVTRQMQEWLSGDAEVSETQAIAKIDQHIDYINGNMRKKITDMTTVNFRLRNQVAERVAENDVVGGQLRDLKSSVEDVTRVKHLVDVHADGSSEFYQRAQEIYETSELEELARSQQEELLRLKRDVDRLREGTFPSFAVVSKRTA